MSYITVRLCTPETFLIGVLRVSLRTEDKLVKINALGLLFFEIAYVTELPL